MYFSIHVFGRSLKGSSFAAQMYGNFERFPFFYCLFQEQGSHSSEGCQSELGYVLVSLSCFLGGGFQHLLFSTLPGEVIQFDEHIFQMG